MISIVRMKVQFEIEQLSNQNNIPVYKVFSNCPSIFPCVIPDSTTTVGEIVETKIKYSSSRHPPGMNSSGEKRSLRNRNTPSTQKNMSWSKEPSHQGGLGEQLDRNQSLHYEESMMKRYLHAAQKKNSTTIIRQLSTTA